MGTPGVFWRGLRLPAVDGTQIDVPDSFSNGSTFDGQLLQGRTLTGFPQVRTVVLAEIGTHSLVDAEMGDWRDGENRLTLPLARRSGRPPGYRRPKVLERGLLPELRQPER
ncbi:hypothetical protein ACIOJE_28775 [Kitasatospora sp. NPDC087861]|uniref:hypothetical protein n=1 Tax=Kitasatospora sp. NPDC087861 TaxID=3364070 RepID=UPI0037FE07E6